MTSVRGRAVVGLAVVALAGCALVTGGRDARVTEADACGPRRFDVYFAENQAGLTEAARTAIAMTATQLQGCEIRSVQVLGLADATGGTAANQTLSEQRALAVVEALEAAGWPAPAFEVGAAGDAGSVTAGGVEEPLRRRAEVLVTAAPAGQ